MLKKSPFFDDLNRRPDSGFKAFAAVSTENEDYIDWNGYLLPDDYGDAEFEYRSIRGSCAIFDVSPLRKIRVRGMHAGQFFDHLLTRPVSSLPVMQASYTVFCNEDGSMKDDAILYKFAEDDYLYMPSDIDHTPYFKDLCKRFDISAVTFEECTVAFAGLAVQGPASAAVLNAVGFSGIESVKPFEARFMELDGHRFCVARMGFTADLGYEIWLEPEAASMLMRRIEGARQQLDMPIPGYGLAALQVCRLEGGFIVAGWDCSSEAEPQPGFERSPYELGLGWLVELDGPEYVGRDALRQQKADGPANVLRNLSTTRNVTIADGTGIVSSTGDEATGEATIIGRVNTALWSWGLNKTIGNASILADHKDLKSAAIEINGERIAIKLGQGPLLNLGHRNRVPAKISTSP